MTTDELVRLISQYRSGIEAELHLLDQLAAVAADQQTQTRSGDLAGLTAASDSRDRIMRSLVTIEEGLRTVRHELAGHRERAAAIPGFDEVVELHRRAAQMVNAILSTDQASLSALADAELARRSAVASLERGETTLAAYRRVLTPPVGNATLVNRRG